LGALCSFQNGVNADRSAYGRGIRFINVLELITHPYLKSDQIPGRVSLPSGVETAFMVQPGDLVFNRSSETLEEVGLASVYVGDEPVVFGGFVIRGRLLDDRLSPRYAGYGLRARSVRSQIIARGQGAIRANIGQNLLGHVEVPLPPLVEQEAIAEALSDADALIESLDQLIAKKRLIKQGVMQELLTGKRRLPGFEGEWTGEQLGSLGTWLSGGTPSKKNDDFWSGAIPWVSPKDMKRPRLFDAIDHVAAAAIGNGTRLLPKGALLVVVRGMILAHSAPVARCERPMAFNQDIKALVIREDVDSDFLLWWLVAHERLLLSKTAMSTHGTKRLPAEDLFALEIPLPQPAEQSAIATVITDLDEEITALASRLRKARQLKQGMMQDLLTGRIRLT
jgi:type I restriction enzyme S subunit